MDDIISKLEQLQLCGVKNTYNEELTARDIREDPDYYDAILESLFSRNEVCSNHDSNPKSPLKVIVSGGGPSGLIFAITLAEYFLSCSDGNVNIVLYEKRIIEENGSFRWKSEDEGNRRRFQVVTLQDSVVNLLSDDIRRAIFLNVNERVWPSSQNIPILEVEDRLLELLQLYRNVITIKAKEFNEDCLVEERPFDALVGADGRRSAVQNIGGFVPSNYNIDEEFALGVSVRNSVTYFPQSMNVMLTLSQTRYLFNSQGGRTGYLNIRLTKEEADEFNDCNFDTIQKDNHPLWNTIKEGLKLFNLSKDSIIQVDPIRINLSASPTYMSQLNDFRNGRSDSSPSLTFLIGDAAVPVHFWPGRGMNSGIKASIALARRLYWAYHGENRINSSGTIRMQDCSKFEGFMAQLRIEEIQSRSSSICSSTPIQELLRQAHSNYDLWKLHRQEWESRLHSLVDRYENPNYRDWPHEILPNRDWIRNVIVSLSPFTVSLLSLSKPWPIREMSIDEVNPNELCSSPFG